MIIRFSNMETNGDLDQQFMWNGAGGRLIGMGIG